MRSKIITISLPAEFLRSVDDVARRERRTRSELIRDATRTYLRSEERWAAIRAKGRQAAKRLGIRSEEDVYQLFDAWRHGTARGATAARRRARRRS